MKISQFKPIMEEYGNALGEAFATSLATELDFSVADRLFPSDGFIPFVDQAMSADLFLSLNEESLYKLREYASSQFGDRLENESAFDYCSDVLEFAHEHEENLHELLKAAVDALDNAIGKIWEHGGAETGDGVRRVLYDLANGILENMPEDMREQFNEWQLERMDETKVVRLRLGCTVDESEKEPFYAFVSLNFDAPYFRSNGEIARNGKPNRELDLCLAETVGPMPQGGEQFRIAIDRLVRNAFPKINLDEHLGESLSLAPGA